MRTNTPRSSSQKERSPFSDWRLLLYNIAIIVFSPYLLLTKINRVRHKKNWDEFLRARCVTPIFGKRSNHPDEIRLLFIGTGLGEKQAMDRLLNALKKRYPHIHATFAAKDYITVNFVRDHDKEVAATFFPFDFWPFVKHWLRQTRPDVVVSLRKMLIPNIIWSAKLHNATVCGLGMPSRKFKPARAKLWTFLNKWTLRGYDAIGFLNEAEKQAHLPLFEKDADVRVTGATRFLQEPDAATIPKDLRQWIFQNNPQKLPVIVTGSLHLGEIDLIIDAFENAIATTPCLLIAAPRRLQHTANLEVALKKRNLSYCLRSKSTFDIPDKPAKVLLLDTMGELSAAYSFGAAAYVGGTLHGVGHNIYEPLEWKVPVFFGDGNGKVHDSHKPAIENGVGFRISSSQELTEQWLRITSDLSYQKTLNERCDFFIAQQQEHFQKNLQVLIDMIELHKNSA